MKTRAERRDIFFKKLKRRIKLSKDIRVWIGDDIDDWIKRKSDVPHSIKSDWWNGFETKKIKNKQTRLKEKSELRNEIVNSED